jgi:hypothetical protein
VKPHYFNQTAADGDDIQLLMAKGQGYVPDQCLLGGAVAMSEVMAGKDPCDGCEGPREKCGGRPKRTISETIGQP